MPAASFTFPKYIPTLVIQISYGPVLVRENLKKILTKQKHTIRIIFNVNKETYTRPLFQESNALNIYQINLLQVLIFMQKIKTSISPRLFFNYFQPFKHVYQTKFSKHNFKQPDGFTKHVKFS